MRRKPYFKRERLHLGKKSTKRRAASLEFSCYCSTKYHYCSNRKRKKKKKKEKTAEENLNNFLIEKENKTYHNCNYRNRNKTN